MNLELAALVIFDSGVLLGVLVCRLIEAFTPESKITNAASSRLTGHRPASPPGTPPAAPARSP